MYVGIDVGAARVHYAALDRSRRLISAGIVGAEELEGLRTRLAAATVVAIDAPAQLSTSPHRADEGLGRKFRSARCAEVALGREYGLWVPWVAPSDPPESGWMATGLGAYASLAPLGVSLLEVYPYAAFRQLAGRRRLPAKTSVAGVRLRAELLRRQEVRADGLELWSHDGLDALAGALVASHYGDGTGRRVGCGHDDSAIWLPAATAG